MKKIMVCLLLALGWNANAQTFEGIIRWSIKTDATDAATKAKMKDAQAQAQQKMNDPATQAKIAEMQAKMNDPQMKAMMDANPQMKAQIESAMKMATGGGDMSAMVPQGMTIELKGGNFITKMEGGAMAMETLFLKDKNQVYQIDRQNKTYSAIPTGSRPDQPSGTPPKITKTSETMKILNHTCTKYIVEIAEHGQTLTENIWATTDIKDIDMKSMARNHVGRGGAFYVDGMEGFPMRIESNAGGMSMTMEVTEIKKETLDPADFSIPADFTETQGMFGKH
jgi:hypothetical protein